MRVGPTLGGDVVVGQVGAQLTRVVCLLQQFVGFALSSVDGVDAGDETQ